MGFQYVFIAMEPLMLLAVACDRYVAIPYPSHYTSILSYTFVIKLLVVSWLVPVAYVTGLKALVVILSFCGSNVINHVFCDHVSTIRLACADTSINNI